MNGPKPTDADRERFRSFVPDLAAVEIKPMFGNLGAFVNRNMFMGLLGSDIQSAYIAAAALPAKPIKPSTRQRRPA